MPHGNDCQCQLCLFDHIEKLETERDRYREALKQAADLIRSGNPTTAEIEIRRCLIDHK